MQKWGQRIPGSTHPSGAQHAGSTIRRRHVYHVAGYDPTDAHCQHRRFRRELATFDRTWSVRSAVSELRSDDTGAHWTVTTEASNWQVQSTYQPLLWDDLLRTDLMRSMPQRLGRSLLAFVDFVRSGTVARYFKANWQYGLFFLFPYVLLCAFAAAGIGLGIAAASSIDLHGIAWTAAVPAVGITVFLGLLRWPGRRWRVLQALDDWIFSCEYLYGRRPDLDARIERFADELVAEVRRNEVDEIVVVGHSMGATLAVEIITRALERYPELGRRGPPISLLTVGSTLPKFTLHPAGDRLRLRIARIVGEPTIAWAEYHARADAISFYKFDPVTQLRFYGERLQGKPVFRRVRLHLLLSPRTYWRNRLRFMRLHYQLVMASERRSVYDYFMLVCGPLPFGRSVLAAAGPAELIAPDGALIEQQPPLPAIAA